MNIVQIILISFFGVVAFFALLKSSSEVVKKNNSFGLTPALAWLGIFVWGDGIVIGSFWLIASLICLMLHSFDLFLLIVSVFWVVRSLGEMIYWIAQQFSTLERNKPKDLFGYKWFKNDSIWFVYQIFWQCIMVVAIIASIYLAFNRF